MNPTVNNEWHNSKITISVKRQSTATQALIILITSQVPNNKKKETTKT